MQRPEKISLHELMKEDIEIARLKKGYVVRGVGEKRFTILHQTRISNRRGTLL